MTPNPTLETAFISAVVLIFGLMIGSFLNVVIFRLPADESIVWPGSRCPACRTSLSAWENIPVLSWLFLRARCRTCQAPISWRYPATELMTGALFLSIYLSFGLSWQSALLLILAGLLIVTFWIDIDHMVILDEVTLPGIALGLLYSGLITGRFWHSLSALLFGVALLLLINSLTVLLIGRDGIGGGDFTLVAMLGAWLGLEQTLLALALSMVLGAVMGLGVLFAQWFKARAWEPFAIALGVGGLTYWGAGSGFSSLLGPALPMPGGMHGALMGLSALMGASCGWLFMRRVKDEGYLEMPFGPALVLGGLGSLFWGNSLLSLYSRAMGS